jgi:SET domain-containing protein
MKILEKTENFKGLFADKNYQKNDVIHKLEGQVYEKPSRTTIEIDINKHIDDEYGIYMNHSFNPNCIIKDGRIVAIKCININEELTFDYNQNETSMMCPFIDQETQNKVNGINPK